MIIEEKYWRVHVPIKISPHVAEKLLFYTKKTLECEKSRAGSDLWKSSIMAFFRKMVSIDWKPSKWCKNREGEWSCIHYLPRGEIYLRGRNFSSIMICTIRSAARRKTQNLRSQLYEHLLTPGFRRSIAIFAVFFSVVTLVYGNKKVKIYKVTFKTILVALCPPL